MKFIRARNFMVVVFLICGSFSGEIRARNLTEVSGRNPGALRSQINEPIFQVKYSEPLAVLNFLKNLSSDAPSNNPFKQVFSKSKYNQEKYQKLIAEFEKVNVDYEYDFPDYPLGEQIGLSTASLLKKNLIDSRTIDEFRNSSIGIVPNESLFRFASILQTFTPVYRELVYEPNKKTFERQLSELKNMIAATNMISLFDASIKFYNSAWDNSVPFNFVFYPLPNSRGFSSATAFANNSEIPIPTAMTNYNLLLGLMCHEIFHIFFDNEPLVFQKEIREWEASNPSKSAFYAFTLLNESLATALGNGGYAYFRLSGKLNEGSWYGRKYVSEMAKKIYPMVKDYVESQRTIDKEFLDNYVRIYDENFSSWNFELDNIMLGRSVLTDNAADLQVIDRKFPYRPTAEFIEGISAASIEKMAKAEVVRTKIICVSKDNKKKLELIKQGFPELKDWEPNSKTDFAYAVLLKDKAYLIIINSVKKTIKDQIETLKINP